jgi:prophage tail gpP-like protein
LLSRLSISSGISTSFRIWHRWRERVIVREEASKQERERRSEKRDRARARAHGRTSGGEGASERASEKGRRGGGLRREREEDV